MTQPPARSADRLPRSLLALVSVCILGLLAGIVLSFAYAQNVNHRLARLEQYVQGRGEYRDQEQRRLEEQVRRSTCDLLDQLPQGALLDRPRKKYGCGPGLPPASFHPGTRPKSSPAGTQAPSAPATPPRTAVKPTVPSPSTAAAAPGPRPSRQPTQGPTSPARPGPLAPITTLCGALGVCP